MKLNNLFKTSLLAGILLSAGACSDDVFYPDGTWNGEVPDEWTMTLVIPDPEVVNVGGTRASLEGTTLDVLLYSDDAGTTLIDNINIATGIEVGSDNKTLTVTVPLKPDTKHIEIVANAPVMKGEKDKKPSEVVVSGEQTLPVLWGQASITEAMTKGTMMLIRNTAKVTLSKNSSVTNLDISQFGVFGTANQGTIAPALYSEDSQNKTIVPSAATLVEGTTYTEKTGMKTWSATNNSLEGFYETDKWDGESADYVRVIFKARYTDADGASIEGFYVAALATRTGENNPAQNKFSETKDYFQYEYLEMLRNHEYQVNVTEVRSEGWPTLEDALLAKPDNRVTIEVEDKSPSITDIEATRDYYLGVGGNATVDYDKWAIIDIATSYPGLNAVTWKDCLEFEMDGEWIGSEEDIEVLEPGCTDYDKYSHALTGFTTSKTPGNLNLRLLVPLEINTSPSDRYGSIKVRAGKLSRTISITQEGCPYSRRRTVKLYGITKDGTTYTENDYFGWIDGAVYNDDGLQTDVRTDSVKGLTREANRGVNRDGLHFPAVPLYNYSNYYYTIEVKDGDGTPTFVTGGDAFECKKEGSVYKITMKTSAADEIKITTGKLRIPAKFGETTINVDFDLFRTGVIHHLKADNNQVTATQRSGWFYYEVVKVGNTFVLDRDLGAASNQAYSPSASDYRKNTDAIGGYFKPNQGRWSGLSTDKTSKQDKGTVTEFLNLHSSNGKFVMATESDMNSWNLNCGTAVEATIASGRVADGKIYFPKAGYYEGDEFKSEMHCMMWTRTYLGGTQGLGTDSPEYGYWYRYFDDMKSTTAANRYSNVRMARGSNGMKPGDSSVWRYMPLRLVWVNNNCDNPEGANESDVDHTVRGKMVVYLQDIKNWSDVHYHVWNVASGSTDWNNLPAATKVGENLYRVEFGAPTSNEAGIMFLSSATGADDKKLSVEFKKLQAYYNAGNTVLVLTQDTKSGDLWNLTCTESGDQDIYSSNVPTPPTPSTRSSVKLLLKNDANWPDSYVLVYDKNGTEYDAVHMTKVSYQNNEYFEVTLSCSDYEGALNDGGAVRFYSPTNLATGTSDRYRTVKISEISSKNTTDTTVFFTNEGATSVSAIQGGKYVSGTTATIVTTPIVDPTVVTDAKFHLKSSMNSWNWSSSNFTYNATDKTYEVTATMDANAQFVIVQETNEGDKEWKRASSGNANITTGAMPIIQTSNNDQNFIIPDAGTYKFVFAYNANPKTLTVTKVQSSTPTVLTVWVNNTQSWDKVRMYYEPYDDNCSSWDGRPDLTKQGTSNWYKITVPLATDKFKITNSNDSQNCGGDLYFDSDTYKKCKETGVIVFTTGNWNSPSFTTPSI